MTISIIKKNLKNDLLTAQYLSNLSQASITAMTRPLGQVFL